MRRYSLNCFKWQRLYTSIRKVSHELESEATGHGAGVFSLSCIKTAKLSHIISSVIGGMSPNTVLMIYGKYLAIIGLGFKTSWKGQALLGI